MFYPAMFGVSSQQMEQAKEVGQHIRMEIRNYRREGRVEIRFILVNPVEAFDLDRPMDKLTDQLAYGFVTMFGMKGEIVDVNRSASVNAVDHDEGSPAQDIL